MISKTDIEKLVETAKKADFDEWSRLQSDLYGIPCAHMDLIMACSPEKISELARLALWALEAREALEKFADFDMDPKKCCWPKNEYMKDARVALASFPSGADE